MFNGSNGVLQGCTCTRLTLQLLISPGAQCEDRFDDTVVCLKTVTVPGHFKKKPESYEKISGRWLAPQDEMECAERVHFASS